MINNMYQNDINDINLLNNNINQNEIDNTNPNIMNQINIINMNMLIKSMD